MFLKILVAHQLKIAGLEEKPASFSWNMCFLGGGWGGNSGTAHLRMQFIPKIEILLSIFIMNVDF